MEEKFRQDFRIAKEIFEDFQSKCTQWTEHLFAGEPLQTIRSGYREIEAVKLKLDNLILALRQQENPKDKKESWKEKEKQAWIDYLYFVTQSLIMRIQELYRCFLLQHQTEAFPVVRNPRTGESDLMRKFYPPLYNRRK